MREDSSCLDDDNMMMMACEHCINEIIWIEIHFFVKFSTGFLFRVVAVVQIRLQTVFLVNLKMTSNGWGCNLVHIAKPYHALFENIGSRLMLFLLDGQNSRLFLCRKVRIV